MVSSFFLRRKSDLVVSYRPKQWTRRYACHELYNVPVLGISWLDNFIAINEQTAPHLAGSFNVCARELVTISKALRKAAGQPQILPPALVVLVAKYFCLLWWLTPLEEVYRTQGLSARHIQSVQELGSMALSLLIVSLVVVGAVAFVWFMGTPKGMQLVHRQTVQTVLRIVEAKRRTAPQKSISHIYWSVAQERNDRLPGVQQESYLQLLSDAGCFREHPVMSPEEFAKTLARVEDLIKLKRSGALSA